MKTKTRLKNLVAMMTEDVPTAFFIGIFNKFTKAGIVKNPPPAPNNPVIVPIKYLLKYFSGFEF